MNIYYYYYPFHHPRQNFSETKAYAVSDNHLIKDNKWMYSYPDQYLGFVVVNRANNKMVVVFSKTPVENELTGEQIIEKLQ